MWAKQLERSTRCTILKQVPKAVRERGITLRSVTSSRLGLRHFMVVFNHERRAVSSWWWAAVVASWRFLYACSMLGSFTEFYSDDSQLIAWTMEIIKGNTLRAMWFYQTDEA